MEKKNKSGRQPITADPETGKVDKSTFPKIKIRRNKSRSKYDANGNLLKKEDDAD